MLSEDHGFWIDFRSSYRIRMVLVEAGRRLAAAGAIVDADDVFHLGSGEVRDALADGGDQQALVAGRKADLERNSAVRPPMLLGTDYGPPPPSPLSNALGKFFGTPVAPAEAEGSLNGHPGSPGKMQGTARVVRSLAEAAKLGEGDVLVCTTIIESGLDIPNVNTLILDRADRFGLAQLYQLRGRVGRSNLDSFCILLHKDIIGDNAKKRINKMIETNDGFLISEEDLKIRGAGEILGKKQSGLPSFKIAELSFDSCLLYTSDAADE